MMFKKLSLQWRLSLLSSLLTAVCCVGLTVMLNISAFKMADSIDAVALQPSLSAYSPGPEEVEPAYDMSPAAAEEARHIHLMDSVLYTLIALCVGGALTYWVSGRALRPVRILNEQVRNISAHNLHGSLEVPPTGDELAELTASFNDMREKLAEAFAVQKRFSADAAHEFRTPLAVMQTRLDVFNKKKEHSPEEYEALAAVLQKSVSRLRGLVTELLAMANMEHELKKQALSLDEIFDAVLLELSDRAERDKISISWDDPGVQAFGDRELLYRAFYNLTENAVKYNLPGGSVKIRAEYGDGCAVITIEDTGLGIPEGMKKQIFEPFFRVDKSRSRDMGGAGLGLSMAEGIIKKHGGTISAADNGEKGSRFTVCLPNE